MNQDSEYNSTKFITGMRGYSALAVFLIHSGGGGMGDLGWFAKIIISAGRYGVVSFFVISAFTIAMSIDKSRIGGHYSYKKYLLNRFFRIFPLLFFVLLFAFFEGGQWYYLKMFDVENSFANFLAQICLLNVFFVRHQNNLVGVEWSIAIEFFYYLLFPGMFLLLYRCRASYLKLSLIAVVTLAISVYSGVIVAPLYSQSFSLWLNRFPFGGFIVNELINPLYKDLSSHWGVLLYLFPFTLGMILYLSFKKDHNALRLKKVRQNNNLILTLTLLIGFVCAVLSHSEVVVTIWVGVLILLCFHRSTFVRLIFENPAILYIGTISYSFYLIHFTVLHYLADFMSVSMLFVLGLLVTILLSSISYNLIELPFIKLGHRIRNSFIRRKNTSTASIGV